MLNDYLLAEKKREVSKKLDKFKYVGFVILEKAKTFLYKAMYEYF